MQLKFCGIPAAQDNDGTLCFHDFLINVVWLGKIQRFLCNFALKLKLHILHNGYN